MSYTLETGNKFLNTARSTEATETSLSAACVLHLIFNFKYIFWFLKFPKLLKLLKFRTLKERIWVLKIYSQESQTAHRRFDDLSISKRS